MSKKPKKKVAVLIVDDHPLMRAGLRNLFSNVPEITVLGEVAAGSEVISSLPKEKKDVIVLLDISLPDCQGTDLVREIKEKYPHVKVVFLSMHQEPEFVVRGFRNGADGYVLKSSESSEILNAIHTVMKNKKYISPDLSSIMIDEKCEPPPKKPEINLTSRELEVLNWVVKGLSAKEIAEKMKISHRTVEVHKQNIMRKFEAKNLADVVRIAFQLGITFPA